MDLPELVGDLAVPVLASSVAVAMFVARIAISEQLGFGFLIWNLFLAWMPVWFAIAAERWTAARAGRAWGALPLLGLWLLFLPNAPYILTDIVHLLHRRGLVFWYDLGLVLMFALAGLLAGVASMRLVHRALTALAGAWVAWAVVLASAMLSGLGIYVGRVLRWNSWDVFTRPDVLLPQLLRFVTDPWHNRHALVLSGIFGLLFAITYLALARPSITLRPSSARPDRDSPVAARPAGPIM